MATPKLKHETPLKRAAIYARYSSDLQSASSIEDEIRLCREWLVHEAGGGAHVEVYPTMP
jgi:site-specific DNA recombinase